MKKKSYCRACTACCAIEAEIENGRIVKITGDAEDPVSRGYTCKKGRALAYQANSPQRLRETLKKNKKGAFDPIPYEEAMAEIHDRVQSIIDRYGPRAVGSFCGTVAYANSATVPFVQAWHRALGSPSNYSTMTIDQPAKVVTVGRLGTWGGGPHTFSASDVAMVMGLNPLVSGLTMLGAPPGTNPYQTIREAKKRGLKLICVDPRRTELAEFADIHLQIKPGQDPVFLAGMVRLILEEDLQDAEFCEEHVSGLEELATAVKEFTPEAVARRCEIPQADFEQAVRLFARGPRGTLSSGTGPDMSPHNCLAEHLIAAINIICGRFYRQGETIPNPGVLSLPVPRPAQVIPPQFLPPFFSTGTGPESRFHGLHHVCGEMPGCVLADEILEPGEGQVRALIIACANPAVSMPHQRKMIRALKDLELSVCIEIEMSETARLCDYVIPSRHCLEREDVTDFMDMFYEVPYAFFTGRAAEPAHHCIEDWQFFMDLAARLGKSIELPGGVVNPGDNPDKFEMLKMLKPATRIPLEEIRDLGRGHVFDLTVEVSPPLEGISGSFDLGPADICNEIGEVYHEGDEASAVSVNGRPCTHLLVSRRITEINNSYGLSIPDLRKDMPVNYAYLNDRECDEWGLALGDLVRIESGTGEILAVAHPSDDIKRGVVSMAHCWGGLPDTRNDVREHGSNTNLLTNTDSGFEPITGQARMSAIPVVVGPVDL